jgi:4-amino-4-deoxy-L-arabinose transferase-like glycosyltransferase
MFPTVLGLGGRRLAVRVAWAVVAVVLFRTAWAMLERQITWYLAVDQFGYLNFATDLLHGRVFHEWKPLAALGNFIPKRTDVLVQTYVRDGDVLYCRYSPGFPILLAGWLWLFGNDGAHYLNPTLFLVFLAVALAFQWRAFRSPWRALAGTAMILLFPTLIQLWGLTLTRDISAVLFALLGLFLLLPHAGRRLGAGRAAVAGLTLGFAVTIRPDAVLYLVPAVVMAGVRWSRERPGWGHVAKALATGALGLAVGTAPALAYNRAATGSALMPTQGMELSFTSEAPATTTTTQPPQAAPPATESEPRVGYPSAGWRGGVHMQVQGGGLKFEHLATTLPGNWAILTRAYTPFLLAVAAWGALLAIFRRPTLAAAAFAYLPLAFVFYSCWPRPDHRYMLGIFAFLPMLIVEGTMGSLDVVRLLWRRHQRGMARQVAAALAVAAGVGALVWGAPGAANTLPPVVLTIGLVTAAGLAVAATMPSRRVGALVAPVLAVALVGLFVAREGIDGVRRAPFQKPAMMEARANLGKLLEPNAVVITTEEVGRPAENIAWYGGADAFYLTDMQRWRLTMRSACGVLIGNRMRPYLYLPPSMPETEELVADLRKDGFQVDLVADIPASRAMAHFVAAPFHRGMRMQLYRVSHVQAEDVIRQVDEMRRRGALPPETPPGPSTP